MGLCHSLMNRRILHVCDMTLFSLPAKATISATTSRSLSLRLLSSHLSICNCQRHILYKEKVVDHVRYYQRYLIYMCRWRNPLGVLTLVGCTSKLAYFLAWLTANLRPCDASFFLSPFNKSEHSKAVTVLHSSMH